MSILGIQLIVLGITAAFVIPVTIIAIRSAKWEQEHPGEKPVGFWISRASHQKRQRRQH